MKSSGFFSRIGFGYTIFLIISSIAQILIALIVGLFFQERVNLNIYMLVSQLSMYVFGLPFLYMWLRKIPSYKVKKRRNISAGRLFLMIVLCFGIVYIGNIIGQAFMYIFNLNFGIGVDNPVDTMIKELQLPVLFLSTVLIAPMMEELVFRKILIDHIIPYGQKAAVIISGVAFGLFHGNFYQFFYAFGIGMLFAYIYSETGTIWISIFMHSLVNFVGGFVSAILVMGMEEHNIFAFFGMVILGFMIIITIVAAIILIFIYAPRVKFFSGWTEPPEENLWRSVFTSPGVWAYLAGCAIMFTLSIIDIDAIIAMIELHT